MLAGLKKWMWKNSIRSKRRGLVYNKRFHSFDTARSVGVVFQLEGASLPAELKSFLTFLKAKKLKYDVLGYYDGQETPKDYASVKDISIFTQKTLNWYAKPISEEVEAFLRKGYDIVIDLCRKENIMPLLYVTSCVQASMIIGGQNYTGCPYDLIVDAQKTCTTAGYIEQVKHYLAIINNPQSTKQQRDEQ